MLKVKKRKVTRTGTSLTITLPPEFVKAYDIQQGDEVGVLADHWLQVIPYKQVYPQKEMEVSKEMIKAIREVFNLPKNKPVSIYERDEATGAMNKLLLKEVRDK